MADITVKNLFNFSGNEAMMYDQFVRLYGTREKVNDITSPHYSDIGEIILPRKSIIHYQQKLPNEVGPSNQALFISNYDKRVNIYFNLDYKPVLGVVKVLPLQTNKLITAYEGGHFNYTRTRNYGSVVTKEGELLVNDLAIGECAVTYRRQTVFTPYQRYYNRFYTLIDSINEFNKVGRHQFIEIPLPKSFPTFNALKLQFQRFIKGFDQEGKIDKLDKIVLAPFQAEQSFWLLDLYGYLLGFGSEKFSLFNRLEEESVNQLEIIFTHEGRCWIVNLRNLVNLISYKDNKETQSGPSNIKINYIKRFYLNLINLVSPVDISIKDIPETKEEIGREENEEGSKEKQEENKALGEDPPLDSDSGPDSLADIYTSRKRDDNVQDDASRNKREEDDNRTSVPDGSSEIFPDEIKDEGSYHWGDDIDNDLFERTSVENVSVIGKTKYSPTAAIERELKALAKTGQLTNKEKDFFMSVSSTYKDIEVFGRTLEEIIDIKPSEMKMEEKTFSPDSDTVINKSSLQSRTYELTKGYVEKFLDRNIMESLVYIQNGKVALTNLEKETIQTADSCYDVYRLEIQPLKGNKSTRRIRIPKVFEDGTCMINGVKTYMQLMRMEKPIRKISPTKVALTSYYDKKIMIERSVKRTDDYTRWLKLAVIERGVVDKSISPVLGSYKANQDKVCFYYSVLASRFKSIGTSVVNFNFNTDELLKINPKWKKYCTGDSWVVGVINEAPVLIDNQGLVTSDGRELGYFEEIVGVNLNKAPIPTATVNINGYQFPAVAVLSYWMGFNTVLELLKPNYRSVSPDERMYLSQDEFAVTFADEKLIFNRRDDLSTLILSGLGKLSNLNKFSRSHLDDPNIWFSLIDDKRVKPTHFKEMSLLYDMFIDPITKRLLEDMKYPFVLDRLIIEAVKLLLNNESKHEVEISEQRIVGYERFSGHVYREIVKATRQFRNKPNNGKKTFDINPEAVMMSILTDSSNQSVEEVNPVHQLKQQEELTFGGTLGRTEKAMVRRTRGQLSNYEGIISEAGKDSGKVGFISYLTTDPKLVDYYGNIDTSLKTTDAGRGSTVLNLLYGGTVDDPKRSLFSSVQQSQVMAADNYVVNPMRTSYDSQLVYRTSELYGSIAKKDGRITEVKPQGIIVEYDDGTTDQFPLGYEVGKGAGEYHKHNKVTDMKVGSTFKAGTVLAWDETYFKRDVIDPTRVVWMSGGLARIALVEDQFTFEDSIAISKKFANESTTPYLKLNDFKIQSYQSIKMHVKVGDKVEHDQVICDIQDPVSSNFDDDSLEEFAGLDRLGIKQIKAHHGGVVTKIEVLYNGDITEWNESLVSFIKEQNGIRSKKAKFRKYTALTGDVGGNTSVGKSKVYPDSAIVYVYIDDKITTTTADKFVVGNQMKGTVGYIYENPIKTLDGRAVDIIFSLKSLLNRMVLSLRDKLVANETNNVRTSQLKNKYGRYD